MREYRISVGGQELTVQLSEEDAKRLGAKPVETKQAAPAANKARAPRAVKKG